MREAVRYDPDASQKIVEALVEHIHGDRRSGFAWVDAVITFAFHIPRLHLSNTLWDLLEAAIETVCRWDESWDQWTPQKSIRTWLATLRGEAARMAGSALRQHPEAAYHFRN